MTVQQLRDLLLAYNPCADLYLEVFSHTAPPRALRVTSAKELNVSSSLVMDPIILITSDSK